MKQSKQQLELTLINTGKPLLFDRRVLDVPSWIHHQDEFYKYNQFFTVKRTNVHAKL